VTEGSGNSLDREGIVSPLSRFAAGLAMVLAVVAWAAVPALAHGDDGEADPVDLVEQALAIVVNTPEAAAEASERVEDALAAEASEPSGELDVVALEAAAAALEGGELLDAQDALMEALGQESDDTSGTDSAGSTVHSFTERVDGGLRAPSGVEAVALGFAFAIAVGGFVLLRRRGMSA